MAIIGTFSSFTTARLAIYASQASLNVTGNNIANINTPGYTRQRMDLVSLYSTGRTSTLSAMAVSSSWEQGAIIQNSSPSRAQTRAFPASCVSSR